MISAVCQGLLSCRRHIGKREDPGDEVGPKKSFCKPPSLLEDLTATEILFQSYAATTTTDWLAYHITSEDMFTREDITTMMHPFPLPELSFRSARFARGFFFSHFSPQATKHGLRLNIWNPAKFVKTSLIKQVKKISKALIVQWQCYRHYEAEAKTFWGCTRQPKVAIHIWQR